MNSLIKTAAIGAAAVFVAQKVKDSEWAADANAKAKAKDPKAEDPMVMAAPYAAGALVLVAASKFGLL